MNYHIQHNHFQTIKNQRKTKVKTKKTNPINSHNMKNQTINNPPKVNLLKG